MDKIAVIETDDGRIVEIPVSSLTVTSSLNWFKGAIDQDEFDQMWGGSSPDGDIQVGDTVLVPGEKQITGVVLEDRGSNVYVRFDGYKGFEVGKHQVQYTGRATEEQFQNAAMLDETETGFWRDYENSYGMIQDLGRMEMENRPDPDRPKDDLEDLWKNSKKAEKDSFQIPDGVKNNAQKALDRHKSDEGPSFGTSAGMSTARTLAQGGSVGKDKVLYIANYFNRHAGDNTDDPSSAGYWSWLLWGGSAGKSWSQSIADKHNDGNYKTKQSDLAWFRNAAEWFKKSDQVQAGDTVTDASGYYQGIVLSEDGTGAYVSFNGDNGTFMNKDELVYTGRADDVSFQNALALDQENRPARYDFDVYSKRANPMFRQNDQGDYDLDMEGEDWTKGLRVGDDVEVNGRSGFIDDNPGTGAYLVRFDDGTDGMHTEDEIIPKPQSPMGSEPMPDVSIFEGGDPESQDFENPVQAAPGYYTEDYFDENNEKLMQGDIVYVFAPYAETEEYLGDEGTVVETNHPTYVINIEGEHVSFPRECLELAFREDHGGKISSLKTAAKEKEQEPNEKHITALGENVDTMTQHIIDVFERYYDAESDLFFDGQDWYPEANEFCASVADKYGYDVVNVTAVLALLSPQKSWEVNRYEVEAFCREYSSGNKDLLSYRWGPKAGCKVFASVPVRLQCQKTLDGKIDPYNRDESGLGNKTNSFFTNIMTEHQGGDGEHVTIDKWAVRIALDDQDARSPLNGRPFSSAPPPTYDMFRQAYINAWQALDQRYGAEIQAATGKPFTPASLQAITWVAFRIDKGNSKGLNKWAEGKGQERLNARRDFLKGRADSYDPFDYTGMYAPANYDPKSNKYEDYPNYPYAPTMSWFDGGRSWFKKNSLEDLWTS